MLLLLVGIGGCPEPEAGDRARRARSPAEGVVEVELRRAHIALESGEAQRAIELAWPIAQGWPERVDVQVLLANAYLLSGRPGEAVGAADRALALDREVISAWVAKGAALRALGRLDQALASTREALKRLPSEPAALDNEVRLLMDLGRHEEATVPLRALLDRQPARAELHLAWARNRAALGLDEEALVAAVGATEVAPSSVEAHRAAAASAVALGRPQQAMDHASVALRLDPQDTGARTLFEAALYLHGAAELRCAHGPGPWSRAQVSAMAARVEAMGPTGVEAWFARHAEATLDPSIRARVESLARARCPGRVDGLPLAQ